MIHVCLFLLARIKSCHCLREYVCLLIFKFFWDSWSQHSVKMLLGLSIEADGYKSIHECWEMFWLTDLLTLWKLWRGNKILQARKKRNIPASFFKRQTWRGHCFRLIFNEGLTSQWPNCKLWNSSQAKEDVAITILDPERPWKTSLRMHLRNIFLIKTCFY